MKRSINMVIDMYDNIAIFLTKANIRGNYVMCMQQYLMIMLV